MYPTRFYQLVRPVGKLQEGPGFSLTLNSIDVARGFAQSSSIPALARTLSVSGSAKRGATASVPFHSSRTTGHRQRGHSHRPLWRPGNELPQIAGASPSPENNAGENCQRPSILPCVTIPPPTWLSKAATSHRTTMQSFSRPVLTFFTS